MPRPEGTGVGDAMIKARFHDGVVYQLSWSPAPYYTDSNGFTRPSNLIETLPYPHRGLDWWSRCYFPPSPFFSHIAFRMAPGDMGSLVIRTPMAW